MVRAVLTKPLDGDPEGTEREFDQPDFDRLKAFGAVREISGGGSAAATVPAVPAAPAAPAAPVPATDPVADEKSAPVPLNKMAPRVSNKGA